MGKLIDATQGRKTRSIIITDSDHIILSGIQVETIKQRITSGKPAAYPVEGRFSNRIWQALTKKGCCGCISAIRRRKTTLCKEISRALTNLKHSISYTTRQPRPNEIDGEHYFLYQPEKFKQMVKKG